MTKAKLRKGRMGMIIGCANLPSGHGGHEHQLIDVHAVTDEADGTVAHDEVRTACMATVQRPLAELIAVLPGGAPASPRIRRAPPVIQPEVSAFGPDRRLVVRGVGKCPERCPPGRARSRILTDHHGVGKTVGAGAEPLGSTKLGNRRLGRDAVVSGAGGVQ